MVEGFGRSEAAKAAWVQRRLGVNFTDVRGRGKILRGSGVFSNHDQDRHVHRQIERHRPNDPAEIQEIVDNFCREAVKRSYEQMLVVTPDGEIHYFTSGNPTSIKAEAMEGMDAIVKGSYNIHTHPKETTQFSFSDDVDMPCFFEDGSAVMEAVDYKYRYRFERPQGVTWEQWDAMRYEVSVDIKTKPDQYGLTESNYEENIQHILIREMCRRLGLNCYKRWRNGDA